MKKNVLKFSFTTSSRRVLYLRHFVLCSTLSVYQAFLLFLKLLSVRNSVWSQKRGQISESAMKDLVYCRLNPEDSFVEIYERKTKNAKPFLRKVHNIEKFKLMKRKPCNE
jgi:hypothetical protein